MPPVAGAKRPREAAEQGAAGAAVEAPPWVGGMMNSMMTSMKGTIDTSLETKLVSVEKRPREADQRIDEMEKQLEEMADTLQEMEDTILPLRTQVQQANLARLEAEWDAAESRVQLHTQLEAARAANRELREARGFAEDIQKLSDVNFDSLSANATEAWNRMLEEKERRRVADAKRERSELLYALAKDVAAIMYEETPSYMNINCVCPISRTIMRDPVMTVDGHSFEKVQIKKWFEMKLINDEVPTSPVTSLELPSTVVTPNIGLKKVVDDILEAIISTQNDILRNVRANNVQQEQDVLQQIWTMEKMWLEAMYDERYAECPEQVEELAKAHLLIAKLASRRLCGHDADE